MTASSFSLDRPEPGACLCFVLKDAAGRFLLHFRDGNPGIMHPLCWSLFGGHVENGETMREGAAREMQEELGCRIDASALRFLERTDVDGKTFTILAYDPPIAWDDIALGEGAGCGYFTAAELRRLPAASPLVARLLLTRLSEER